MQNQRLPLRFVLIASSVVPIVGTVGLMSYLSSYSVRETLQLAAIASGSAISASILTAQWLSRLNLSPVSQPVSASTEADGQLSGGGLSNLSEPYIEERTRALVQANAEFEALFAAMDQLVFVYDRDGRHIKIPETSQKRILYHPDEKRLGKTLHEVFPSEVADQFLGYIQRALTLQETITVEYSLTLDGETTWSDASISPIDQNTAMWVARNVTDRKQTEQELQQKNKDLSLTLAELKTTQTKLIQSEKLAALGQLVAGVAHEMNTPLGAICSSVENVSTFFKHDLQQLPHVLHLLSAERRDDLFALLQRSQASLPSLSARSSREKRQLKRNLIQQLEQRQVTDADQVADTLMDIGIYENIASSDAILNDKHRDLILTMVYQLTSAQRSVQTIETAAMQTSKVVLALKTYARKDNESTMVKADVIAGIETTLMLYANKIKRGVNVVRDYEEVPLIRCCPDELNQVWANLIHNAIQAMDYTGTLTISTKVESAKAAGSSWVQVGITDTGTGIASDLHSRLFEPFFTTKPMGEGSGLGLSIVKKIIDKHEGAIAVHSIPGRTTFTVSLSI
ncbi:PAS domain-containing sensor histidine kinase [Myxacorys almedinensis]|uniref:histidine kinase n=1 Tax=Myxacorys almedinensis A TaxID=2690445 RepID=A0A8J8CN24_9CYAN|nr:ATP-binding protein [Myxacorys almedinensis]NDJ19175.1 PAS domain-containing protein [Myxacorys almedinensis A]